MLQRLIEKIDSGILSVLKDSSLYTIGVLVTQGVGFLLFPLYARLLTAADFGSMSLITIFTSFFNNIVSLQLYQAVMRYCVEGDGRKIEYFSTAFFYYVIVYLLILTGFIFLKGVFFNYIGQAISADTYSVILANLYFSSLFYLMLILFRLQIQPKRYLKYSMANLAITTIGVVYLVLFKKLGLFGIYTAQLVGSFTCFFIAYISNWGNISLSHVTISAFKKMLTYGAPLIPNVMFYLGMMNIDKLLVEHFLGVSELGAFAVALKFLGLISLAARGVQMAWGPRVLADYKKPEMKVMMVDFFYIALLFLTGSVVCLSFFSKELILFLAGEKYLYISHTLPFLLLAVSAYILGSEFSWGYNIRAKNIYKAYICVFGFMVNLFFGWALIPRYGLTGAALANLISMLVYGGVLIWGSNKLYTVQYGVKRIIIIISIFLLGFFMSIFFDQQPLYVRLPTLMASLTLLFFAFKVSAGVGQVEGVTANEK